MESVVFFRPDTTLLRLLVPSKTFVRRKGEWRLKELRTNTNSKKAGYLIKKQV
ncbi:hypothetical protein [Oceanobacillus oncorhynchi]|uniref:hypothetical protein n=1 Tax=Oceanobacillus oncorhynchi TaxID=545501 RepID=UPI002F96184C